MAQCSRCIHSDVCRYSDKIAELKNENPFIKDITCNYQVYGENPKPVKKQQVSSPALAQQDKSSVQESTEDPKSEVKALAVKALKLHEDFTEKLAERNIHTIGDIYTYEREHVCWENSGLDRNSMIALSRKLEALNLPALKL